MAIGEVMRLHARLRPHKVAIVEGERRVTFGELDRRLDGFCQTFFRMGVRRGEFVAVALGDTTEHLMALLGLSRLGAIIVPMDHRWSDGELSSVAANFGAARILVDPFRPGEAEGWMRVQPSWFEPGDTPYHDPKIGPDSPLALSLSSGTTGTPKGPCASHQRYENRFMAYWLNLGFNAHDRFVSSTPLYFGGGRGFAWAYLFAGATVHLFPPPFSPAALIDYVNKVEGTSIFLVPTMIRRLLETEFEGLAFPTLHRLVSSGSALFPEERRLLRERLSPNLYEMYSSSEGGAISVLGPQDCEEQPDSVGRPCFRVEVEIVDADDQPLPNGETGALRYRSPATPQEYFGGNAADGGFRNGWFYPGDLAELSDDGFIRLRGRSKDVIIRGGVNIYPADIEQTLLRHPDIEDAVVLGMPAAELGEEVAAFVVSRVAIDETELSAFCRETIAPYKVPRHFVFLRELPRNAGGKVLKADLKDMLAAGIGERNVRA